MSASTPTTYTSGAGTVQVDSLTKQILVVKNQLLALPKFGGEDGDLWITQGCWRPWTEYSGPTHRGCAACDETAHNWENRFHLSDLLGQCPFHRTPAQGGWKEHIHTLTCGMGCIDKYAAGQIVSAKTGHNGLKGNGPDPDKNRRSGLWPLAVYQGRTGKLTSLQHTHLYDKPMYTKDSNGHPIWETDCPKGTVVKALMEVNVNGDRWFVTDKGEWGFSGKWAA